MGAGFAASGAPLATGHGNDDGAVKASGIIERGARVASCVAYAQRRSRRRSPRSFGWFIGALHGCGAAGVGPPRTQRRHARRQRPRVAGDRAQAPPRARGARDFAGALAPASSRRAPGPCGAGGRGR